MHIHCLGINHRTAPLEILERLYVSKDQAEAMLSRAGCGRDADRDGLLELVLLSTCNRVEAYALSLNEDSAPLRALLAESGGLSEDSLVRHLYHHHGLEAVRHLLRVSAGLDSMVLGEPQILGQVAEAHTRALRVDSSGPILSRVFRSAIHAGKRARSETDIATNPTTTSAVAVAFASDIVQALEEARVVVIGAGEMAELAVEALRKRGVSDIIVVNRTVERAESLATRWNARAQSFEQIHEAIAEADIVITSTAAPHPILHAPAVSEAMAGRPDRPMVVLDIAVPRDVDPQVADIQGLHLHDLESLSQHLEGSLERRSRQIPAVEGILEQEMADFEAWYESLKVRPLIAALHQRAESIRVQELERSLRQLGDLDEDQVAQLEALTRALVKKLLHAPTMSLKEHSRNGTAAAYTLLTRDLFRIDPPDSDLDRALESLQ